jgi:5'-methylthioadenosine phosphorylase
MMAKAILGVIGGSGVYDMPGLDDVRDVAVESPWGEPSDSFRIGRMGGTEVVFLPRHGRGHRFSPSDINYRANIDAMKRLGVTDIVSVSACGSLRPEIYPGLFVLVDQFVDRTYRREGSFFGRGCVAHVSMARPVSPLLQQRIADAAAAEDIEVLMGGAYLCIEGPQFSSYAESTGYRAQNYDVIGMTNMPEAKLAREAEISYASIAMVTDYDCWHPEHDAVDVAAVIAVARQNASVVARLLASLARDFPAEREPCPVGSDRALDGAIMTAPSARDPERLRKLDAVAGRVLTSEG